MAGGSDSLEVLRPGVILCSLALFIYFVILVRINRRKAFIRSGATAEVHIVDRKRRKERAGLGDSISDGGCALVALLMILLLIVDLFLVLLERVGLRERKYRYIDHSLILEFQATTSPIGESRKTIEMKVSEPVYESNPPGSVISIRYSMENPNMVELAEEITSQ
jgi:hypothetical protein